MEHNVPGVGYGTRKSPCMLDDDPAQPELLTEQVASVGLEAVATPDPEDPLQLVRRGSPATRLVSVKLIAATNRDLRAEVLAGRFREDLCYRLSYIQIRVMSLSERLEDIPLLVQYFLRKYNDAYGKTIAGLTRRAQALMLQHGWPGNVRELENVISSACIMAMGDFIDIADLPEQLQRRADRE
jgi:DNA-binding NtrC family response regulator